MAELKKNGVLSGALENVVFVDGGDRTFVRSRPTSVKQTERSKASAAVFGFVSRGEKYLRPPLLHMAGFPALKYFAARHRGRLQQTVSASAPAPGSPPEFGNPAALTRFEFNPQLEWARYTNFEVDCRVAEGALHLTLPELRWSREIRAPKKCTSAVLRVAAVVCQLNGSTPRFSQVGVHTAALQRSTPAASQQMDFSLPPYSGWLLVAGTLHFLGVPGKPADCHSGTYLLAEEV